MHPDRAFRFVDDAAMRTFVKQHAFAHLFVATSNGPMVAHVPLTPTREDGFRFHVARSNRITAHLDGATVLASIAGPDGYISPDWYVDPKDQVPTWNYATVEIDGTAHALTKADLVEQIDTLSHIHESRLAPKPAWSRDKVAAQKLAAMYRAIDCFELRPRALRGTCKYSQNKSSADRAGVRAALGDTPLARAIPA